MKKMIMILATGIALSTPAFADKPSWAGKGKPTDEEKAAHVEAMKAKREGASENTREKSEKYQQAENRSKEMSKDRKSVSDGLPKPELEGKKIDAVQKDIEKGAEQAQASREERKKWWQFW